MWFVLGLPMPPESDYFVEYTVERAFDDKVPSYAVHWASSEAAALGLCALRNATRVKRAKATVLDGFEELEQEIPL